MSDTETKQEKGKAGNMTIIDHLSELRVRVIRFMIVMGVCVLCCYFFRKELLDLIKKPVEIPLQKYTSSENIAPEHAAKSNQFFNQYICACEDIDKDKKIESKPTTIEPPKKEIIVKDHTALTILETAKNAVLDFISYFQVILGNAPTANPDYQGLEQQTIVEPMPGYLNLNCTCNLKQDQKSKHSSMVYIGLPELFFAQMKTAIFAGFFLAFPYLLIELWGFIGPALYKGEKAVFWLFSIFSYICFIGGSLFGYFIVFPFGFDFFLSLTQPGEIIPSLSIGEYLTLSIKLLLAFGFIFEMPLVTFILARLGVITPELMIKQTRFAVLVIFLISAFLTPPDPFTMMLMAGPLLLLYIISIIVCFFGVNRKKVALRAQGLEDEDFE